MALPSSRGSARGGSSSSRGGSSRGGSSRGGSSRGGGGSTNAVATVVAVAVVGLIVGIVILMSNRKEPPMPKLPSAVPSTPVVAAAPVKPGGPAYPVVPAAKLAEATALVKTFEADGGRAEALYRESQEAKKAGDETKWQSKLGEASDLMTGINEKWNGFIEGLPTSKDYDFEDVAKHYFPRETGLVAKYTKLLSAMKSDRK